ncbi:MULTISPECIES: glutaredoxin domain-containing protein [Bacillaceae]|uniref:glutaredoxin domain-containing protein n=1 Tax=Bacillales TaxID=1385 RepID=UPI001883B481|nr:MULTISPECIES: glutaredoxin domain-containing protein [Bacillaceae]MBF0708610.1 thioredoxin family protein [Pseudalkalibacillus hwajinpoensis]MDO6655800.1 glutaredoxin domain-containing protein [Anaerobacillus sp. 1_MG-2023]WLR59907.1 glutaredoxin domain-containing protein [Pseudalkalibacillus hwajinpoensis]
MKKVKLYTQPACPPCEFVKNYFQMHEVKYELLNIKENVAARNELIHDHGSMSTPTIVIDGEVIIGFEQERIDELLNISSS